ncbi:MAG TPA: hypothetical protein VEZ55_03285 [Chitinophagaceae bacterium]|nr:hypothetical protein [Chitinophagaceae bacterium]
MEEKNHSGVVPEHYTGKIIDTEESVDFENSEAAKQFFSVVKDRLIHVNKWNKIAGALSADFQLIDPQGVEVDRAVQRGDYFKIDIPGPGTLAGDGYDWVKVEEVEYADEPDVETVGIRVRPTTSPLNDKEGIAHFYSEESTSSFTVARKGNRITAGIYDRNTKRNKDAATIVDKIRDAAVGTGAVTAFSKMQWSGLAKGLLQPEDHS